MKLSITPEQVAWAKKEQAKFDAQKTHNKFKCSTNYIGLLGEVVFDQFLKDYGIEYKWIKFTKKGWKDPDFIIKNKSVDLKTTFSDSMWIQQEKFDYYIYARINEEETELDVQGWMSKYDITECKNNKACEIVTRNGRQDYVFSTNLMKNINTLFKGEQHEHRLTR
jgi:hypothetical protein